MMRILNVSSVPYGTVYANLVRLGAAQLFIEEIAGPVWAMAVEYAVDPVGAVAQSFKETGAGRFTGLVKPEYRNTCGLKRNDAIRKLYPDLMSGEKPLAHQDFPDWVTGARAHVQHLRAYAGAPVSGVVVSPRYGYVIGKHKCEHFADLSGKWAPSPTYGQQIEEIAAQLMVPPEPISET